MRPHALAALVALVVGLVLAATTANGPLLVAVRPAVLVLAVGWKRRTK